MKRKQMERDATIKLHKQDMPIRPIIDWTNAPPHALSKHLSQMLHNYLHLPYIYNIRNSVYLITDLQSMEIN
jgi:hypothetical protein